MTWLLIVILAIALSWLGTRLIRDWSLNLGLVDAPDGFRKLQARPVPLGGGIAVLCAAIVAVALGWWLLPEVRNVDPLRVGVLLAAAVIIAIIGLIDDVRDLRARHKLLAQFVVIAMLVGPGNMVVHVLSLLGWQVVLPLWLAYPITFLWFLAAINAVNLLDGMDGLLGTVGGIACAAIAAMAIVNGYPFAALVALAMAGALIGFLRYNLPPASIYLGDCGSMLVGLIIAATAIEASVKARAVVVIAPAALLVLPFLDTSAAIVRRQLSGRGWAVPDRDHLHHVLQRRGMSIPRVLMLVAVLGGIASIGAFVSLHYQNDLISLITTAGVILTLLAGGFFGSAELRLIRERAGVALYRVRRLTPISSPRPKPTIDRPTPLPTKALGGIEATARQ